MVGASSKVPAHEHCPILPALTQHMNRLYCDIEVSPDIAFTWRIGYKINLNYDNILKERAIICIGYKWEHEKQAKILVWDKNQDDKAMLKEFIDIASLADEVVMHNGDRFDLPWIRTRCLFHGVKMMPDFKTIDTLQWARRKFYFNSNRLDYLGKFMGFGGKIKTEFDLWKRIVLQNDNKALKAMCDYCKRDVVMLQDVHTKLADYMPHKTHVGVLKGKDKWTSPFNGGTNVVFNKKKVTAGGSKSYQMQCKDTGRYYTINESVHSAYVQWRKDKEKK